jgi:hypothetical protein
MAPRIAAFGLGVAGKVEDLYFTFPSSLAPEDLFDGHGARVRRVATVVVLNRRPKL